MASRQRIKTIISGKPADRCGLWLGNPHGDTWPILHKYFGTGTDEQWRQKLHDDFRWHPVFEYCAGGGRAMFPIEHKVSHGDAGPFANATDPAKVADYDWPDPALTDFEPTLKRLRETGDVYRASGMWTCFYHNVMGLFGMESYLANMYENPAIVEAVTDRVCQFYYDSNERFFPLAADLVDAFFFGNDFGTQLDLICGPEQFDRFVMPWFKRFTDQGHRHGLQVILHSCGSIERVIDRLIDSGVNCLHPLQARARNMDAVRLAEKYKGRIAFLGGIDTQDLLVNGNPAQVRDEVRRVKDLLGPCLIVSPSHEAILPNVPPQNIAAMAEEALR